MNSDALRRKLFSQLESMSEEHNAKNYGEAHNWVRHVVKTYDDLQEALAIEDKRDDRING